MMLTNTHPAPPSRADEDESTLRERLRAAQAANAAARRAVPPSFLAAHSASYPQHVELLSFAPRTTGAQEQATMPQTDVGESEHEEAAAAAADGSDADDADMRSHASSQPSLVAAMQGNSLASAPPPLRSSLPLSAGSMAPPPHGAGGAPVQWRGAGTSPPFGMLVPYGDAKIFLGERYESRIIKPQQREIDSLRAEVARLSGVLQPSDPRYQQIVRETTVRFAKPGSVKLFDKRRQKLQYLIAQLRAKEDQVEALIHELGELRLNCALYTQQLQHDDVARERLEADKNDRVARWAEEQERRMRAKEEKLQREQERVERQRKQQQQPANAVRQDVLAQFMPRSAASSRPASRPASRAHSRSSHSSSAPRTFLDDEAVEDSEEIDDADV